MTCIVGIQDGGAAVIAADSAASSVDVCRASAVRKIFSHNAWMVGYSGSFRMGQLLKQVNFPDIPVTYVPTLDYVSESVMPLIRAVLKDNGYAFIENNQESIDQFLLAAHGEMFEIENDLHVHQYIDGIYAIGSGAPYALGALNVLPPQKPAHLRAKSALLAAAAYSRSVLPPYYYKISSRGTLCTSLMEL